MNERVTELQDILKARPNIEELAGMFLLCMDATGMLKKSNASLLERKKTPLTDINNGNVEGIYSPSSDALNVPVARGEPNSSDQIVYLGRSSYGIQIYIPLHVANVGKILIRPCISDSWGTWCYFEVIKCT